MTIVRRLSPSGDMTFGLGLANFAADKEACRQNVGTRLQLVYQEWFLDQTAGVPYLQDIVGIKPINIQLAESALKTCILDTDDVASLTTFSFTVVNSTRKATVNASVLTVFDSVPLVISTTLAIT